ncbi:MAG: N-acetylmuramoyl-L-alanine amidase family protein [Bacillota bacterium]
MLRRKGGEAITCLVLLRRESIFTLGGLLFTAAFLVTLARGVALETTARFSEAIGGRRIVLDPGHGGPDPGAVGRTGIKEKDLVLDIAVRLRRLLGRAGAYVVMTRETDRDFGEGETSLLARKRRDLAYRVSLANRLKADVYLSIHANSIADPRWVGAQVFYYPGRPLARELAGSLQAALAAHLGPNYRLTKPAEYRVLVETQMPAVVVEVGFLSNPDEEALLASPAYREKIAEALYRGLLHYFLLLREKRESFSPGEPVLPVG